MVEESKMSNFSTEENYTYSHRFDHISLIDTPIEMIQKVMESRHNEIFPAGISKVTRKEFQIGNNLP